MSELDDPVVRLRDAARALHISTATLRDLVRVGEGPQAVRVGRRLMAFRRSAIEAYLTDQTILPHGGATA